MYFTKITTLIVHVFGFPVSLQVDPNQLDNRYCHIQVVHVTPYFDERELQKRLTDYERNNNVKRFMFETPFTKDGKAHGEIDKQCKRRTILTSRYTILGEGIDPFTAFNLYSELSVYKYL